MKKRDDINLGNLSGIADEEEGRQRTGSGARPVKNAGRKQKGSTQSRTEGRPSLLKRLLTPSSGDSVARLQITGLVIVLLLFMGLSAFFSWQINQIRSQLSSTSEQSTEKLGQLQSQLQSTGENLTEVGSKVEETLKLHDSEIRKLWEVAYKRNTPAIEGNSKALAQTKKQVGELEGKLAESGKVIASQKAMIQQLETRLALLADSNQILESRVEKHETVLAQHSARLEDGGLADQVKENTKKINGLSGGVESRLSSMENSVESINSFRKQTNSELESMRSSIRDLMKSGS